MLILVIKICFTGMGERGYGHTHIVCMSRVIFKCGYTGCQRRPCFTTEMSGLFYSLFGVGIGLGRICAMAACVDYTVGGWLCSQYGLWGALYVVIIKSILMRVAFKLTSLFSIHPNLNVEDRELLRRFVMMAKVMICTPYSVFVMLTLLLDFKIVLKPLMIRILDEIARRGARTAPPSVDDIDERTSVLRIITWTSRFRIFSSICLILYLLTAQDMYTNVEACNKRKIFLSLLNILCAAVSYCHECGSLGGVSNFQFLFPTSVMIGAIFLQANVAMGLAAFLFIDCMPITTKYVPKFVWAGLTGHLAPAA